MSQGSTGVELKLGPAIRDTVVGRVFKFLHLGGLVEAMLHHYVLEIVLDEHKIYEKDPLQAHFVPCAPGQHRLAVSIYAGSTMESMSRLFTETTIPVEVVEGKTTVVHYDWDRTVSTPGHGTHLTVVE